MTEAQPSVYEQVGGGETFLHAVRIFMREVVPANPELAAVFGNRSTDPEHRDPHENGLSWALGAIAGGPGHELVGLAWIDDRHPHPIAEPVFNGTVEGLVHAFGRTGEELQQPTNLVIETLVPLIEPLKEMLVHPANK